MEPKAAHTLEDNGAAIALWAVHVYFPLPGNSQYSQQQTGYQQGTAQQQAYSQQQYPNQQSYPGQQQGYGKAVGVAGAWSFNGCLRMSYFETAVGFQKSYGES